MQLTRREFLCGAVAGGSMLALPRLLRAQGVGSYSVPVLGDIHFDSPDPKFYHTDYTHSTSQKRYKAHLAEHVRNSEMWKERLPRLVRASGACLRKDAAFALQMGDFVQGDCGNAATHRQMLDDAFAFVKGAYGGNLPLVTVAGNHDIRGDMKGDGARETLEKWLLETMAKELGVPVKGTTFSFRQGPDVFIVVDFNEPRPKLSLIKRLLEESKGARYTFFISHGLVVPNSLSRWFLLGEEKHDAERRELCSLLARRNAIVLCGHTHRMELLECEFPEGQITQFTFNSVWTNPAHAVPAIISEGAGAFGEGGFLKEYKPFVRRFMLARAAGHYTLDVSDAGVSVAFYGGDATTPSRMFRLR